MEVNFTDQNFESEVLKSDKPVFVDFWAPWCGPCQMMGPIVEEMAKEMEGKNVKIGKLNVDENPETAAKFGIRGIPTLMLFKDGQVAQTNQSPLNSTTSSSNSLSVGSVTINTQATDASGIAQSFHGEMQKQYSQTINSYDDGVAY